MPSNKRRNKRNSRNSSNLNRRVMTAELQDLNDKKLREKVNPESTNYLASKQMRKVIHYNPNQSVTIKRSVQLATIGSSTTLPTTGSFVFALTDLPNYTDITTMFDTFRFEAVVVTFIPRFEYNTAPTANDGLFYVVADYDDGNTSNTQADLLQYDELTYHTASTRPWQIALTPKPAIAAYGTASFSAYSQPSEPIWIDAASANAQHYGLKYVWSQTSAAAFIDVVADYYVSGKSLH
jgi:hypothetical protein